MLLYQPFFSFFCHSDKTHCGHLFSLSISHHGITQDKESFLWNIIPSQSMPHELTALSFFGGWGWWVKGTFELQWKYRCKENMSVQNKSLCIMSRQMVLRRILSNGDDRQADRLAQTLPLRRPGERPGQFLSLSMPTLSLCLCVCLSPSHVCLFLSHVFLSH